MWNSIFTFLNNAILFSVVSALLFSLTMDNGSLTLSNNKIFFPSSKLEPLRDA